MEIWNREELYSEVWEKPLGKVGQIYGVSAVMVGKVCKKLKIPLPGRGYWAKKQFGKTVVRATLPQARDLPTVRRFKISRVGTGAFEAAQPEPTDNLYKSIIEMESRAIRFHPENGKHKVVVAAQKVLVRAQVDSRGILDPLPEQPPCLDIRVTKESLDRALAFANAVVTTLDSAHFPVTVQKGRPATTVLIFGHAVPFAIVEKLQATARQDATENSWGRRLVEYRGTGILEFRVGDYVSGRKVRDGKKRNLESVVNKCIGALMREGRARVHEAERKRHVEMEKRERDRRHIELSQQIREEEERVKQLETWVDDWIRAKRFVSSLMPWRKRGQIQARIYRVALHKASS